LLQRLLPQEAAVTQDSATLRDKDVEDRAALA
jgi:hypothetical protein